MNRHCCHRVATVRAVVHSKFKRVMVLPADKPPLLPRVTAIRVVGPLKIKRDVVLPADTLPLLPLSCCC